ncbi:MAG: PepSY domain-containing protein [Nitrospirota bacterium]|nr:PepSY domain-containing protein [Nitrospirota bacterium]
MRTLGIFAATVVGLLFAVGSSSWADDKEAKVTDLVKEAKITIDQAIKTASEKVPGTVVEAELEKKHGKTIWEVEVLGADGNVTEVHIDAATGTVIDTEAKKDEKKKEGKKGK